MEEEVVVVVVPVDGMHHREAPQADPPVATEALHSSSPAGAAITTISGVSRASKADSSPALPAVSNQ